MVNKDFQKGIEYEKARKSMRFHLWLGYGSIIYLAFYVFASIFNQTLNNIWTIIILLMFGLISLWLGYDEKKELRKY